jgi:small multidrug resistance pump
MLVIVLEVCGTIRMKLFNAFSRFTPSILMFVFYGLSIAAFVFALKRIDVSTAYIIWAGLGVLLISVIGIAYFEQCISALKIV